MSSKGLHKANARSQNGFDFKMLCDTFNELCSDFRQTENAERSQSLDFANKVLFDIGPRMRQIKQSGNSQLWRLVFEGGSSVLVYTYTFKSPINVNPHIQDRKLYLTLKQAGLLAATKLCSILPSYHSPLDKILLTPLARAVFPPQNIPKIALVLTARFGRTVNIAEVVKAVICSCQTDGFHLQYSQCHIGVVAIEATVTDVAQRQKLRDKTIRVYEKHGKTFNMMQYKIYAEHSKLVNRSPDPMATIGKTTSDQKPKQIKSISSVIREVVKSVNDPLSGGTLELQFAAAPVSVQLPTPIDVSIQGTSLSHMRSSQLLSNRAN